MKIKRAEAWWVRIPIAAANQHRSDFGQITTFDAAILRIETDDGIVGWGEGKNAAGSAGTYGALVDYYLDTAGSNAGDWYVVQSSCAPQSDWAAMDSSRDCS